MRSAKVEEYGDAFAQVGFLQGIEFFGIFAFRTRDVFFRRSFFRGRFFCGGFFGTCCCCCGGDGIFVGGRDAFFWGSAFGGVLADCGVRDGAFLDVFVVFGRCHSQHIVCCRNSGQHGYTQYECVHEFHVGV